MTRPSEAQRELAWIGDAVLSLFARSYILREGKGMDPTKMAAMTSNQFLSCFGNPTLIESEIGQVYTQQGLEAAFQKIETDLVPLFQKQWLKRSKRRGEMS
jgi:hypothetical protein